MSVSGAGARRKGSAFEREIRQQIRAIGIECKRVPLSGAAQGFKGDLQLAGMTAECKRRKRSYSSLYQALEQGGGSDLLFVRDDQPVPVGWPSAEISGEPKRGDYRCLNMQAKASASRATLSSSG